MVNILPGLGLLHRVEQWAGDRDVDRARTLDATYAFARGLLVRVVGSSAVCGGVLAVVVGAIAGTSGSRLVQYGILGAVFGGAYVLAATHSFAEAALRPARVALADETDIGDSLPRSQPTIAAWSNLLVLGAMFIATVGGAVAAAIFDRVREVPVLAVVIGGGLTLAFAVPLTVSVAFAPSLRPIRELAEGTKRVAAGDYTQRLPVVQDDDLGALSASFNRMQAGLAERQRLQAAFGTYVIRPWRRGCLSKVTTSSPVSAAR